jgi:hypothetical protein
MSRKPKHTLEEIIDSINKHQNIKEGCKTIGISDSNFYQRLEHEGMELVKTSVYSLKRKHMDKK